jgi:hypothetical protein
MADTLPAGPTAFFAPHTMSAEFLWEIMDLHLPLHLHMLQEESAELPKEFSTLSAELHLRQVPRKSVQRLRWRGWIRLLLGLQRQQPPGAPVLGVSGSPRGLLRPLALGLALQLRASTLSLSDASVRSKPLSAEATRARPVTHPAPVSCCRPTTTPPPLRSLSRASRLRHLAPRGMGQSS